MSLSELFAEVESAGRATTFELTGRPIDIVSSPPPKTIPSMDHARARWPLKRSETKQRHMDGWLLYDLEVEYRKVGWGDPAFVHDEERELFRFRDGRFAFSREHADWALLKKACRLKGCN